jgi:hypothetical protein
MAKKLKDWYDMSFAELLAAKSLRLIVILTLTFS